MNQRTLIKQLGLKSTMRIRDYFSCRIDEDRPDLLEEIQGHCDAKIGDIFYVITFHKPMKGNL